MVEIAYETLKDRRKNLGAGKNVDVVYFNFSGVFDRVLHSNLLHEVYWYISWHHFMGNDALGW